MNIHEAYRRADTLEGLDDVRRASGWQLYPEEVCASPDQIQVTGELVALAPLGNLPRPAGDEGHAVSAFPRVSLDAAQVGHTVMAVLLDMAVGGIFRAVVAAKP